MMHYTTTVTTDAQENYIITIPDQILNYLEWKEGDTLNWQISDSKQIIITKIKTSKNNAPTHRLDSHPVVNSATSCSRCWDLTLAN